MSVLAKLKARASEIKVEVWALFLAARHPRTPWYVKLFVVTIVAYALSPIDLIPDFVPLLGFLDEIILLPFAIVLAVKMVPAGVMAECRARAAERRPDGARAGRIAALVIVLAWVGLIAAAALWFLDE
jgi:uncharacterized membrane protein YkvA (DUF1232 family)